MDIKNSQNIEKPTAKPYLQSSVTDILAKEKIASPLDCARLMSLYIRESNEREDAKYFAITPNYIRSFSGTTLYNRFKVMFDKMYEIFLINGISQDDMHIIFKTSAEKIGCVPSRKNDMAKTLSTIVLETKNFMVRRKLEEKRKTLADRFNKAVKKYMNLTYSLGYNSPSECSFSLVESHKIDKYIMSGDFSVLLFAFMPDLAEKTRMSYENYEMKDSWEIIKCRYFDNENAYSTMALEIKTFFKNKTIKNFSDYFDSIYRDVYYRKRLLMGSGSGS